VNPRVHFATPTRRSASRRANLDLAGHHAHVQPHLRHRLSAALMVLMQLTTVACSGSAATRPTAPMPIGNVRAFMQYVLQILFLGDEGRSRWSSWCRGRGQRGPDQHVLDTQPAIDEPA